jgi:hypothetical protein
MMKNFYWIFLFCLVLACSSGSDFSEKDYPFSAQAIDRVSGNLFMGLALRTTIDGNTVIRETALMDKVAEKYQLGEKSGALKTKLVFKNDNLTTVGFKLGNGNKDAEARLHKELAKELQNKFPSPPK